LDHGINLISPDDGYGGLRRHAIRKTLMANATKKPEGLLASAASNLQFTRSGADVHTMHNAIRVVVPGGDGGPAPATMFRASWLTRGLTRAAPVPA
jgi:hypothetical protein